MKLARQDALTIATTVPNIVLSGAFAIANSHPGQASATVAVAMVALFLRVSLQVPMRHARVLRLLEAAKRNPDVSFVDVMAAKAFFPEPDPEILEAEVRARLRDISEALDPATVEPLYRLLQSRLQGRVTQEEAVQIANILRALSGAELREFERLLIEVLATTSDETIRLVLQVTSPPAQQPLRVAVIVHRELRDLTLGHSIKKLCRLLRDAGSAEPLVRDVTPRATLGDGSGPVHQEMFILRRTIVSALLQAVASGCEQ